MDKLLSFCCVLFLSSLTCSCGTKKDTSEADGQKCLAVSRQALAVGETATARAYIDTLRMRYPTALNAREEGILLLDSIDLADAIVERDSAQQLASRPGLDNIARDTLEFRLDEARQKVTFFEKKIEHDRQQVEHH